MTGSERRKSPRAAPDSRRLTLAYVHELIERAGWRHRRESVQAAEAKRRAPAPEKGEA